jgi:hypothetical protein
VPPPTQKRLAGECSRNLPCQLGGDRPWVIGPVRKLLAALCKPKKRPGLSISRAKAKHPTATHVLMEKTNKRYGEKEEHWDFSPFWAWTCGTSRAEGGAVLVFSMEEKTIFSSSSSLIVQF